MVDGQTTYPSAALNENQRELNHFAVLSWQHSQGAFDVQTSATARYSSLTFTPDPLGDVLFTGIAQDAYKQNVAYALQSDAAYKLDDMHTLRGGVFVQSDRSKSLDQLAGDCPGPKHRHSNQRCADDYHRQRRQDRVDREPVPAG